MNTTKTKYYNNTLLQQNSNTKNLVQQQNSIKTNLVL